MSAQVRQRSAAAKSLLAGLAQGDVFLRRDGDIWLCHPSDAKQTAGHAIDAGLVDQLLERGFLKMHGAGPVVTQRGRAFACPAIAPCPKTAASNPPAPVRSGRITTSESPLDWLRKRKGAGGAPLIGEAAYAAGERLRAEYTRAGLMPRVTADLTGNMPGRGRKSGARGPADMLDTALDARDRVNAALSAVGGDMAGLLIDVCCNLESLAHVETARGWPKRSAKVVLDLALGLLADHYGLSDVATGPRSSGNTGHWGAQDYRPAIE